MGLPETLFHYCDCPSFYSIISSKKFRLHSVFESNDSMERRWIDQYIQRAFSEINVKGADFDLFRNTVLRDYDLNRGMTQYFLAFSQERDLLSQWRGYANDASGFTIGINPRYFELNEEKLPVTSVVPEHTIGLSRIVYDEKHAYERVRDLIKFFWNEFERSKYAQNSPAMIACAIMLARFSSQTKNSAFHEEKEWRILYSPLIYDPSSGNELKIIGKLTEIKFVAKTNQIKSFFEIPFGDQKDFFPINEIILGPKNKTTLQTVDILLGASQIKNVKVSRSNLSYR